MTGIKIFSHRKTGAVLLQFRDGTSEVIEVALQRADALKLAKELQKHAEPKRPRKPRARPRNRRKEAD